MARIKFRPGEQRKFFEKVLIRSGLSTREISRRYSIGLRSFNDWRREKYNADYEGVVALGNDFRVRLRNVKKLDDYWYTERGSSIGGKIRFKLYGPPGTIEDRKKGGRVSQERRREDPEKYRRMGCNVKKVFTCPPYSEKLAEVIGIILGDGSINDYQVRVTLSRKVDRSYAIFVRGLIYHVFGEWPSVMERVEDNTIELTISGSGLVEVLEQLGLRRGNKIVHQVDFPKWVSDSPQYGIACVRGLFDTDGGLYFHKKGLKKYLGWCFASFSGPLLKNVMDVLLRLGFNVKKSEDHKLYMYSLDNISRYMRIVGSSNPKNSVKLNLRIRQNNKRRGA